MDSSIIIIISLKIYMFAKLKKLITINSIAADKTGKTLDVRLEEIKKEAKMEALKAENYVGKVRFQFNSENPADLLGFGTWILEAQGMVPVGFDPNDSDFDTVGKTGGEKTHKLTVEELAKHRHPTAYGDTDGGDGTGYRYSNTTGKSTQIVEEAGGDQPHNNMQPFVVMYIYRRIA